MVAVSLSDARSALVRGRILGGVEAVLRGGHDLTFANVSGASGVPERTCYRYFPTREALLGAVFDWVNERIGWTEGPATDAAALASLVRRAFPGFDAVAPVVQALLATSEGRAVRVAQNGSRRRAALALARREAPGLDDATSRRVAAALQLLTLAATWQTFREYWDMDGAEAAETSVLAAELLILGARAHARTRAPRRKAPNRKHQKSEKVR